MVRAPRDTRRYYKKKSRVYVGHTEKNRSPDPSFFPATLNFSGVLSQASSLLERKRGERNDKYLRVVLGFVEERLERQSRWHGGVI